MALDELKKLFNEILKRSIKIYETEGVLAVIVFGSAARGEDFVKGVSDVDVLVLTRKTPKHRYSEINLKEFRVSIVAYSINEFNKLVEIGDPLTFMLKYSIILYNKVRLEFKPKITEYTARVLRRSVFVALELAIEKYFRKEYLGALSHLYHSVRHLARYKAILENYFPVSDKEVIEHCSRSIRDIYSKLVKLRKKREVSEKLLEVLIDEVVELIAKELKLKPTYLKDFKDKIPEIVLTVLAVEVNNWIIFRLEVFNREIHCLEVKNGEIRPIERKLLFKL